MLVFTNGVLACACAVAVIFFLRSWRDTRDRLFLFFAAAFAAFMTQWTLLGLDAAPPDARHELYLLRLAGFILIIVAVVDKNWRERPRA